MDMEKLIAQIVEQLRETNRLLALIAVAPHPRTEPKPNIIRSVALDGTVREAVLDDHGVLHDTLPSLG